MPARPGVPEPSEHTCSDCIQNSGKWVACGNPPEYEGFCPITYRYPTTTGSEGTNVHRSRSRLLLGIISAAALLFGIAWTSGIPAQAATTAKVSANVSTSVNAAPRGELDCNGFSPVQKPLREFNCTDIRGTSQANANTWGGRFYDNNHYIGHDEPDATFNSSTPGSGGNVTWTLTLGKNPQAAPTDVHPGHDVTDWFELSPAPWFSMALCDPNSFPQTSCAPNSDSNAPTCDGPDCTTGLGGGSAFMEMQFYPPGNPPFIDSQSCDDTHWCAALTIDSLECTAAFASCNTNCEEPLNFGFIQRNGAPTGPPAPGEQTDASETPNSETLLMNPGDKVSFHMFDAPARGGGDAFEVVMDDLTTHQTGFMQASAANGFSTTSMANCSETPFNFQPEFNTAKAGNINSWGADQVDICTEFETGHWEPCTSLSDQVTPNPLDATDTSPMYNTCASPYESAPGIHRTTAEVGNAVCFAAGDTHQGYDGPGTSTQPDEMTGCQDDLFQNGDLDFLGPPYYRGSWPTGPTPTNRDPSSFFESFPTSNGQQYSQFFFQTDIALSEYECGGGNYANASSTAAGCTVPPAGPGNFYPYWTQVTGQGSCSLEFGNVSHGSGLTTFGQDKQYGTDQFATFGYPQFIGQTYNNPCAT